MSAALASLLRYGKNKANQKLQEINLDDNGLKDDSFALILDAISDRNDLLVLNYNNNGLGLKSVAALSKIFSRKNANE